MADYISYNNSYMDNRIGDARCNSMWYSISNRIGLIGLVSSLSTCIITGDSLVLVMNWYRKSNLSK